MDNYQYSYIINVWTPIDPDATVQTLIHITEQTRETKPKPIEFSLYKTTYNDDPLAEATIQITNGTNISEINGAAYNNQTIEKKSGGVDGCFGKFIIAPKDPNKVVTLDISEITAPTGYAQFTNPLTLTIHYEKGKITRIDDGNSGKYASLVDDKNVAIKLKNELAPQEITIKKEFLDEFGKINNNINNRIYDKVKFDIIIDGQDVGVEDDKIHINGGDKERDVCPDENGEIKISNIINNITIFLREKETVDGYTKMDSIAGFKFKFNNQNKIWELERMGYDSEFVKINEKLITINNPLNKDKTLIIQKIDEQGNPLSGIKFNLKLDLIKSCSIAGSEYDDIDEDGTVEIDNVITDKNGQIKIEKIEQYLIGDVGLNGKLSGADTRRIARAAMKIDELTPLQKKLADINQDGKITSISNFVLGDVNGDGVVKADDSSLLGRYLAGNASEEEKEIVELNKELADCVQDGKLDDEDAKLILSISAGITEEEIIRKFYEYTIDTNTYSEPREPIEGEFSDAEYCGRTAAGFESINYSLITVNAIEVGSTMYENVEKTTTFYCLGNKVVEKNSFDESNENLVKNFIEKNINDDISAKANNGIITMVIENSPKPYSLTLQKKDKFNNVLGEGYLFTITIDKATKIKIDAKYLDEEEQSFTGTGTLEIKGNTVCCKTDSNGQIIIKEIYATSLDSDITVEETRVGNKIFSIIPKTTITKTGTTLTSSNEMVDATFNENTLELGLTIKDNLTLNLNVLKKSNSDVKLKDAKFNVKIEAGSNKVIEKNNCITDENGQIVIKNIDLTKLSLKDEEITVTLTETVPPEGFVLPENPTTVVKLKYDSTSKTYKISSGNGEISDSNTLNITIINGRNLPDINLMKIDSEYNGLKDIEFNIELTGVKTATVGGEIRETTANILKLSDIKTNDDGFIQITNMLPKATSGTQKITIKIKEVETKQGLKILTAPIECEYEYNLSNGQVKEISRSVPDNCEMSVCDDYVFISAINDVVIDKLDLLKTDSIDDTIGVEGAEFNVTLSNIKAISGRSEKPVSNEIKLENISTNKDGNIILEDLVVNNLNENVKITVQETKAPEGYKKINGTIEIVLKRTEGKYTYEIASKTKSNTISDIEVNLENVIMVENTMVLRIKNIPTITLSGKVWKDAQTGVKNVQTPNGKYDKNEELLKGIKVYLYNKDGSYTNLERTTDGSGKYEFKNIPKTKDGYYIVFEYNGIKYNNTITDNESKASEDGNTRKAFNERFKIISKGQSNDGTPLEYEYDSNKKTSTLKANIDGTNPASEGKAFKMQADTDVYTNTKENINYGLKERYFDLSLGTDVESAIVKINGKETKYDYNQILNENGDLKLDSITQNISANNEPRYSLYLYKSDYNYRISDYIIVEGEGIQNTVNPNDNVNYAGNQGNELEAFVTYKVMLKNQSTHEAAVKEFVYYYDDIYEAPEVSGIDRDNVTINIDERNKKITFTDNNNELNVGNQDYRKEILITFKVKKDSNGNLVLKDNCTNAAEITKYSTKDGGLIDNDSAPDNANITRENGNLKLGQYEDDTDQAAGINIKINQNERKIAGTVFEDLNADKQNNDNKPVQDVIVQLIEIKKINNKYYEYIWQETKSETDGKYEFTGFIPANYIIRFIYGDGRTYTITSNVEKYNGQDYKSTYDEYYKDQWYSNHGENLSVARDNEARRLEVMSHSSIIDGASGVALETLTSSFEKFTNIEKANLETYYKNVLLKDTTYHYVIKGIYKATYNQEITDLNNVTNQEEMYKLVKCYVLQKTWMVAETSKIDAKIESSEFKNMNFGLMERPKTKLTLEKHITALKITPSGVGVQPIVDAKANIEEILGDTSIKTEGLTDGLSTIKSTRDERGWWKVETDIEELAQGAKLEVEYTYVINNNSEKEDYLDTELINAYSQNPSEYANTLIGIKTSVKKDMKELGTHKVIGSNLGQFYYTGIKADTDSQVLSQVETLEEALNNQLSYNEAITDQDFVKANTEKVEKTKYNASAGTETIIINTEIKNAKPTRLLGKDESDYSKKVALETTLSSSSSGTIGGSYPSYIAQIVKYSNAAGRRNVVAIPGNLSYVHSDDTEMTMAISNEADEFWGETITISKPTGEDKQFPVQIAIIVISSIAVIGVGIILIKKFALKTK